MTPTASSGNESEAPAATRPLWRSVAIPTEHGGWGLTLEPVVLGLAVAPSLAGIALGAIITDDLHIDMEYRVAN